MSGREVVVIAGLAGPGGILPCSLGSDGLTGLICGIQPFLGLRDQLDLVTARDDCHFHTLNVSVPRISMHALGPGWSCLVHPSLAHPMHAFLAHPMHPSLAHPMHPSPAHRPDGPLVSPPSPA